MEKGQQSDHHHQQKDQNLVEFLLIASEIKASLDEVENKKREPDETREKAKDNRRPLQVIAIESIDQELKRSDSGLETIDNTALKELGLCLHSRLSEATKLPNELHNPDPYHTPYDTLQEDLQLTSSDEELDPVNDKTTPTEQPTKLPNKDNPMNTSKTNPITNPNPTCPNEPLNIDDQPKKPIYDEEKRKYKCPNCLIHYQKNKWKLTRHLKYCQENLRYQKFKCNICHRGFIQKRSLRRHQEKDCKK